MVHLINRAFHFEVIAGRPNRLFSWRDHHELQGYAPKSKSESQVAKVSNLQIPKITMRQVIVWVWWTDSASCSADVTVTHWPQPSHMLTVLYHMWHVIDRMPRWLFELFMIWTVARKHWCLSTYSWQCGVTIWAKVGQTSQYRLVLFDTNRLVTVPYRRLLSCESTANPNDVVMKIAGTWLTIICNLLYDM